MIHARTAVGTPHMLCGRCRYMEGCTNGRLLLRSPSFGAGDILTLIRPKLSWGEAGAAQRDNRVRCAGCCATTATAAAAV